MKTGMKSHKTAAKMGRPRAFDKDQALDAAVQVFWRKGYEGTSLSELTEAMGINRPSLYAAFGDKEQLFRQVLDRYAEGPTHFMREALNEPTARKAIERVLRGTAEMVVSPGGPRGCLMVQSALTCGDAHSSVQQELTSRRAANEAAIRRRLKRAKAEGDLPADANPADLARFVATVLHGIAVQAAGGASRAQLARVVCTAIRAWPE